MSITADSDSKVYDGTALTNGGWTASGIAGSDSVSNVIVIGSQTLVGQSANVASDAVVMRGGEDVTANYNITYVDGTLTVNKVGTAITRLVATASAAIVSVSSCRSVISAAISVSIGVKHFLCLLIFCVRGLHIASNLKLTHSVAYVISAHKHKAHKIVPLGNSCVKIDVKKLSFRISKATAVDITSDLGVYGVV